MTNQNTDKGFKTHQNTDKGFKTHQEMWEYLIGGGEICLNSDKNVRAKMENGMVDTPYNIGSPAFWVRYEQSKWYENIPEQGILCRVWDVPRSEYVHKVVSYIVDSPFPYEDERSTCWHFAEPLTYEEAIDLIYKPLDT